MIAVFGYQHVRQQAGASPPTADGRLGAGACVIVLARAAGQLGAHVPDDAKRARHIVEQLGHVLAEFAQGAAAFDARAGGIAWRSMLDDVARQRRWEWTPRGLVRRRPVRFYHGVLGLGLGDRVVEIGQRQF